MKPLALFKSGVFPNVRHHLGWERRLGGPFDGSAGCFLVRPEFNPRRLLRVIASNSQGWDHVSVSCESTPSWDEMDHVKRIFFADSETVMQLHVPASDHVNVHTHCLHLWRPNDGREIPRPPASMV